MATHEHAWVELRRQIPWTEDDFDKDLLAPERARYALDHPDEKKRGQLHSDEDHYAKVPLPRPEIVFKCYGCDTVEAVPIPAKAYKRIVEQIVSGEIDDTDAAPNGRHTSRVPLETLLPELRGELEKRGLLGTTGAREIAHTDEGALVMANLSGEAAMAVDEKLREQLDLSSRKDADDAVRASSKKYEAEGRKASTHPADARSNGAGHDVAPEAQKLAGGKE